ncbi:MAG: elongation factor G [Chloroflexota bacterium]
MQQFGLENIRNIVLLSHSGAGKTSISEAILVATGAISRRGRVDEGSSTSDYDPEEIKRKISLSLALLPCQWQDAKINLIDTPGYLDFVGEVKSGIRVSEGAMIVVCATSGVEVGTEQSWTYCEEAKLPRLIFINKMDRENADFYKVMGELESKFGSRCLPLQLPIGAHNDFEGLVDLLALKGYTGSPPQEAEIPAALTPQVDSFRNKLVEGIAENDDQLLEKYLDGGELSPQELEKGLAQAIADGKIVPVLVGSALKDIGITSLLDTFLKYLPSPKEGKIILDGEATMEPGPDGPLAALVFKTSADPYVGKLTYFRVYSGSIASNSPVWNGTHNSAERIGQLFMLRGKTQEPVATVDAGNIGAVAKLNVTNTGDTLCTKDKPVKIAPVIFPKPIFTKAVRPKTKADLDKLGSSLSRLSEEDPTLEVHRDSATHETILAGMGETHLEVAAEKMLRKFGVDIEMDTPKVPYRETVTSPATGEYKHRKQTGGHGQYGHVKLEVQPLPRGSGCQFAEKIVGGSIPKNYIPAVEKGVNETVLEGVLAHYPVVDIKAVVYDGSFHPVDSSDICFKIAGAQALKKALADGHPVLLEPIVNMKITIPEEFTGDIISDLNTKRARVLGMNPGGGVNYIEAQAPLSETLRYAIDLKSITQGRGIYTIEFDRYEETPAHISQKIIAEREAEKARG